MNSLSLSSCESEAIRTPGAIQPHGLLLVLRDNADLTVEAISENCTGFLGVAPASALGQPARKLLGSAAIRALSRVRAQAAPQQFECTLDGRTFDCQCYAGNDGRLCVDLEPTPSDTSRRLLQLALPGLAALRALPAIDAIAQGAAELVHAVTGFDRVMVYRFDAAWNGAVIAEASPGCVEPYLGLNFPASDIPAQARELYLSNLVRNIPDAHYRPVALISDATTPTDTIDLGQSQLRSVSPIHLEYMRNMGVRASLVGSLIVGGRLWGLLTCHHWHNAKTLCRAEREIFAWICGDLSSQLAAAHSQQLLADKTRRATQRQRLLAAMYENGFGGLMTGAAQDDLFSIVHADGFALVMGAQISTIGLSPTSARIAAWQARRLERGGDPNLFYSHALATDLETEPNLATGNEGIAGALFISLLHRPDVTMVWLRRERIQEVFWGGDPHRPHEQDEQQRISPRRSFAAFRQIIHGQSQPWTNEEIESAQHLGALIEIEVQRGYKHRLEHSETIYRSLVNAMAEGIVAQDPCGEIITCNPRAEEILGLSAEQMRGRTSLDPRWRAIHEDGSDFPGSDHPTMVTLRTGLPSHNVVMGVHTPDERLTWISINTEPLVLDGAVEPHGVVATFLDITERKRIQSEDLAAKIFAAQEEERARLSHDLHDEVGQTLTALKIAMIRAQQGCSGSVAKGCFDQAQQITERLMADVRSLAHQLRPAELDALGLVAALRSHFDKFVWPAGLAREFCENLGEQRLPTAVELCCFRVVQEALTNCVRHARANAFMVTLDNAPGVLNLNVNDNGVGFDSVKQSRRGKNNRKSLGLIGMRERVAGVGGQLQIRSAPGQGTEILARFVLAEAPP
jgi:PAS domain S-box-containing protein